MFTRCDLNMDKYAAITPWQILCNAYEKKVKDNPHLQSYISFIDEVKSLLKSPTGIVMAEKSFCYVRRYHDWSNTSMSKTLLKKMIKYGVNWRLRNNVF